MSLHLKKDQNTPTQYSTCLLINFPQKNHIDRLDLPEVWILGP